ncbi:thyroid hormone receptor interactor 4, putative [Ichthyophthirius multifiliis]|uniref:Thyroid hormone receptor interactor 4, putative n=1 Tax=Ichthyophthirius multifiliis TaxID=5932 RepID=G0QNT9_ICHMU|nr:thyroid hormone receptor interactor 4, putative [Ichthyophthirius multifiliis]EGR33130.1 thyroid hormone receptor interactor 4, putative [Ichthyophthirius multifiliis]|eukprot:XP_004037116.1 thyroid hormone receptor interactor 4, putative [Ichthyophthirius multifiliis]
MDAVIVNQKKGKKKINLEAPLFPGRQFCQCHAQMHNLINNCLTCGRIICEQEGIGPCFFCGNEVLQKGQRADFGKDEEEFPEFQDPTSEPSCQQKGAIMRNEEFRKEIQAQIQKEIQESEQQFQAGEEIYDQPLYNINLDDEGKCLSMLQPWASLLIEGYKRFEGRYWNTEYKGVLWIHAGATIPTQEQIEEIENQYKEHYKGVQGMPPFPKRYPTGCLLGCIDLQGVLTREKYIANIPEKYREDSQCEYIFVVRNPKKLFYPIKMKGSKQIFDIPDDIRINCKSQLIRVPSLWYPWVAADIDIDLILGRAQEQILDEESKNQQEQNELKQVRKISNMTKEFMNSSEIHTKMTNFAKEIKVKMDAFGFMIAPFLNEQEIIQIVNYVKEKLNGTCNIGIQNVQSFQTESNFPCIEKITEYVTKTYCYFTEKKKSDCLKHLKEIDVFYLNQKQRRFSFQKEHFLIIILGCDYEIVVQDTSNYKTKNLNVDNGTFLLQLYDEKINIIYENPINANNNKQISKSIGLKENVLALAICFKQK